jgi:subtilisin family serine protease
VRLIKFTFFLFALNTLLFLGGCSSTPQKETYVALDTDCYTFNLGAECRPKIKPKSIKKVPPPRSNYIKDELVLLYPKDESSAVNQITQKYHLKPTTKVILSSVKTGMIVAKTNGQNPLSLSKTINNKEKNVEASTNNTFAPAASTFKNAYSMYETGVRYVHQTTKGKGVSICMIDTPVDIYHPSFSNALIDTIDIIKFNPNDTETMLHGTTVAGVLVSQNKHIGIAPKARLLAINAFSTTKLRPYVLQGTSSDIARGIDSCIQRKVDVINMSFTGGQDSLIEKMVTKAIKKGIIVVAAGGNGGHQGSTIYPALIPGVLAATAVDKDKRLFKMADKGRFIDYAAPGVNILTVAPENKYKLASGTSLSSAHVSGIVALLLSQKHNRKIDKALTETAIDLGIPGRDQEFGEGLVSASRALAILRKPSK